MNNPQVDIPLKRAAKTRTRMRRARAGFSLVEIMVVLVVASIVVAVSVRGFTQMTAGNRRTICQTNLSQIYNGLRLYMADESGQTPPFNVDASGNHVSGIGLWALYTYDNGVANTTALAPVGSRPVSRYIRNLTALHCPADDGVTAGATNPDLTHEQQFTDDAKTTYNPEYLSYGAVIDANTIDPQQADADPSDNQWPYLPTRATTGTYRVATQRQLAPTAVNTRVVPPDDDTVVTWCPYHRVDRNYDEVLFFDGTVRYLPHLQDATITTGTTPVTGTGGECTTVGATCLQGAQRVPRVAQ